MISILASSCAHAGPEVDRWETGNPSLQIRVIKREEVANFLPGAYFSFESRSSSSRFRQIMEIRHDDPIDIPKDAVHVIGEAVAYIAFIDKFAVTTDFGRTWSIWDVRSELPGNSWILTAEIGLDGRGVMVVQRPPEKTRLRTTTFGRSWAKDAG